MISLLQKKKIVFFLIVTLTIQFFFLFSYTINGFFFDDAFITYRFAYNLEEYNFFTYNLDKPVYGTTTPLYALILFFAAKIVYLFANEINYHILSQIVSILFFTALMLFVYFKFNIKNISFFILFILIFFNITNGQVLYSGMETFFIMFLLIIFLHRIDNDNIYIIIPFLVLGRFDIALIAFLTFISFHLLKLFWKQYSVKELTIKTGKFSSIFLISFIPCYLLFEEIIPNTIYAKSVIYTDSVFEHPLLERFNRVVRMGFPIIISLPILLVNAFSFILKIIKKDIKFLQLHIFLWGYFLFLILFITNINQWYFPPLSITAAIIFILNIIEMRVKAESLIVKRAILASIILIASYTVYADKKIFIDKKNDVYSTGLYKISKEIEPNAKVFCADIGIVGFFSRAYIYDYAGLVTPQAINFNRNKIYYPEADGKATDFNSIITQIKNIYPDYIIFRKIYPFFKPVIKDLFISENYYMEYNGKYDILMKKNVMAVK